MEPEWVPDGWVHYPDWSCKCWFYVPGSAAALPEPIAWEPCPVAPEGVSCAVMVADWTQHPCPLPSIRWSSATQMEAQSSPSGGSCRTTSIRVSWISWLMPMARFAPPSCGSRDRRTDVLRVDLFVPPHMVIPVFGDDNFCASGCDKHQGAIGGSIDELRPTVLHRYEETWGIDAWRCSSNWYLAVHGAFEQTAFSWTDHRSSS